MKKALTVILASSLLLMPLPVYASETQDEITVLKFEKLQEEIIAKNPTAKMLDNSVSSISYAFKAKRSALEEQSDNAYFTTELGEAEVNLSTAQGELQTEQAKGVDADQSIIATLQDQIFVYNFIINYYRMQIGAMRLPSDWEDDLDKDKSQAIQKVVLTADMMTDLQVWLAQNYYIAYNNSLINQADLQSSRELTQKNVTISQIRKDLGMATLLDVTAAKSQLKDNDQMLKVLSDSLSSIRGELNLLLGQDFNTQLRLETVPEVDEIKLSSMNYEEDQELANINSYTLRLAQNALSIKKTARNRAEDNGSSNAFKQAKVDLETEEIKLADEQKKLEEDFDKAYNAVLNKKTDLQTTKEKLSDEQAQYNVLSLKHTLGMIAQVELDAGTAIYRSKVNKVKSAEHELFKAYQAYDWMLKGLNTVSTGGASSSSGSSPSGS